MMILYVFMIRLTRRKFPFHEKALISLAFMLVSGIDSSCLLMQVAENDTQQEVWGRPNLFHSSYQFRDLLLQERRGR